MNIVTNFALITLLAVVPTISSGASEVPLDVLSKTIWERNFGDADYMYQNKAMAFSSKDSALLRTKRVMSQPMTDIKKRNLWHAN